MHSNLTDGDPGNMTNNREQMLRQWAEHALAAAEGSIALTMVSGDASFRRYFRLQHQGESLIAVDAPPEHEDNDSFLRVDELLLTAGVRVPRVRAADKAHGFMLLEDFGDSLYLSELLRSQQAGDLSKPDLLYKEAIDALVEMQASANKERLGPYSREELGREMALFDQWFCEQLLEIELSANEREIIDSAYGFLEDCALGQEAVFVHRDYHSRNLMLVDDGGPGIIDFQDAVSGPYTYDLVSLLRDCYIRWPQEQLDQWAGYYLAAAQSRGIAANVSPDQFQRDLDLMGLQRHLKVMGIFSRLFVRDNKSRYLADIPLVIHYFLEVSSRYSELSAFRNWFQQSVLPLARKRLAF